MHGIRATIDNVKIFDFDAVRARFEPNTSTPKYVFPMFSDLANK